MFFFIVCSMGLRNDDFSKRHNECRNVGWDGGTSYNKGYHRGHYMTSTQALHLFLGQQINYHSYSQPIPPNAHPTRNDGLIQGNQPLISPASNKALFLGGGTWSVGVGWPVRKLQLPYICIKFHPFKIGFLLNDHPVYLKRTSRASVGRGYV